MLRPARASLRRSVLRSAAVPLTARAAWVVRAGAPGLIALAVAAAPIVALAAQPAAPPPPPSPVPAQPAPSEAAPGQPRPGALPPPPPAPGSTDTPTVDPFVGGPDAGKPKDLSKTWGYSSSSGAPAPNYVKTERESAIEIRPVGFYSGVRIGNEAPPPIVPVEGAVAGSVLTWTGFEVDKATDQSRVFFQLSSPVAHQVDQAGTTVRVLLPGVTPTVRNNLRALDTRFFDGPVEAVDLRRDGGDVVVTIRLERVALPQVQALPGAGGYTLLVVSFPNTIPSTVATTPAAPQS